MSEQSLEKWKTDHLLLLVGGNPLPNYVAAKLLSKQNSCLHLIHTPETKPTAERIRSVVAPHSYQMHEVRDPAKASDVSETVASVLAAIRGQGSIGLNYTGGTKSMAVHAHAIVAKEAEHPLLTYLDSRSLSMYCDGYANSIGVQFMVEPALSDILDLAQIKLTKSGAQKYESVFPSLEKELVNAHITSGGAAAYGQWCSDYLRRKDGKLAEKVNDLLFNPIPFPVATELTSIGTAMRESFGVDGESFDPHSIDDDKLPLKWRGNKKVKRLVEYLDGIWVEYIVMAALHENAQQHRLHSIVRSLDTIDSDFLPKFEFDVAAMQGYQLCGISSTRSSEKGLCKSKLFEAYVRAAQLGGSEAKTALVCAYAKPELLEKEILELWRPERQSRLRVFGADHLPNLGEAFAEWLKTA